MLDALIKNIDPSFIDLFSKRFTCEFIIANWVGYRFRTTKHIEHTFVTKI